MNQITKETSKVRKQIDKIAKKGKDGYVEYYSLVDEFVSKGKFDLFKQSLFLNYEIYGDDMVVDDLKKVSWPKILLLTNSPLQELKSSLLLSFGIYQVGIWYYTNDNTKLGWSKESRIDERISIKAVRTDSIFGEVLFDNWDDDLTINKNIINLYTSVIEYFLED